VHVGHKGQTTTIYPKHAKMHAITIKTRIHPGDLMEWVKPKIAKDFKEQL
jgi:hypothetical protein